MKSKNQQSHYWPIDEYSIIDELFLDQFNIRLPISNTSQNALIQDLFSNEDALDIVKSYVQNGVFSDEFPIVVKEKGKLITIEGNRRLAALKALNQPDIVPSFKDKIKSLGNRKITTLRVVIAPNRESAIRHIANKHTINYRRPWKPLRQAYFYKSQLENGKSIQQLTTEFPEHDIVKFIKMLQMHHLAKSISFQDYDIMQKIHDERKFPITNLERMYENSYVQNAFGFSFDSNGHVLGTIKKQEFDKGYRQLIEDIATGVVDSRKTNTGKQIEKYIDSLPEDIRPDVTQKGKFNATTFKEVKLEKENDEHRPRSTPRPMGLFLGSHVPFKLKNASLRVLYDELRDINVERFPNATHDLLRSFLECALIVFFKQVGEFDAIQKTDQHNPKLGEMLTHIINGKSAFIKDANIIGVIKQIKSDYDSPYSLERMNMINHNENWNSSEKEVRSAWSKIESLMKIVLNPENDKDNK